MKIVDRLRRLEACSTADEARQRQIAADAADFVRKIEAMAARVERPAGTAEEFWDAIRASGDPRLIAIFFGGNTYAHC